MGAAGRAGLIWGASFLFIAEGLDAVEPNGVTFARIAVGFLTLSLFPSARKPVARADWAGTAGLVVALSFGVMIRHERVTTASLIGAGICLLGAAIVRNPHILSGLHFREVAFLLERSRGFRL